MTKKRKQFIFLLFLVLCLILGARFIFYSWQWHKAVEASASFPWQDGGEIIMVRNCVLDSPPASPTTCAISCPQLTMLGASCVNYNQLDVNAQLGTTFIAVPKSFQYSGGGTTPRAGIQFLAGGISNIQPKVVGIPK